MKNCTEGSFEAWLKSPVYVAHCRTWALAIRLGVVCHEFRCIPAYRNEQALTARKRVADTIRRQRELAIRKRAVLAKLVVVGQHNPETGYLVDVQETINLQLQLHQLQREEASI